MIFENLKTHEGHDKDHICYSLDEVKKKYREIIDIDSNHWLVFGSAYGEPLLENCSVQFALFEFYMSNCDGSDTKVSVIFHGSGPSSSLRECRHIWWGEKDGYTFYLPGEAVIKALKHLEKYFDWD